MARRVGDLHKSVESMLLRPHLPGDDCRAFCLTALRLHLAAVCVPPTHVRVAAEVTRGSDVKLVALISHPFGADAPSVKALACRLAIEHGADEVEVVVDLASFASGDPNHIRDELRLCIATAREVRSRALVRAVIETGAFDDRHLRLLVRAIVASEVDMIVTSSGLAPEADGTLDVALLREEVGPGIGVKAVRGVRSADEAASLLAAGATRVGTVAADALFAPAS